MKKESLQLVWIAIKIVIVIVSIYILGNSVVLYQGF